MSAARKFEFDHSFDVSPVHHLELVPPPEPPPPPPPTFSLEEIAAAREQAYAEGMDAGIRETEAGIARALADAAGRLAEAIERSRNDQAILVAAAHRQAAETMLALVNRMFPALIAETGTREIAEMVDTALRDGFSQPRLLIRCGPALAEEIKALSTTAAERAGFIGTLSVMPDPAYVDDDCRIEWVGGGAERSSRDAMNEAAAVLDAALAAGEPTAAAADTDASVNPIEESAI